MSSHPVKGDLEQTSSVSREAAMQVNHMGFWFLRTLPKDSNAVISPYALANTSMLLYQGAVGETRRAVNTATRCGVLEPHLSALFHKVSTQLLNDPESTHEFDFANLVLVGGVCDTNPNVARYLATCLQGRTQHVPEQLFCVQCSERLWKWTLHTTRGEVDHFLDVDCSSKAPVVAASALFFRGSYAPLFNPEQTRMGPFENMDSGIKPVPMVRSRGIYGYIYSRQLHAQAVRIPYDSNLSLLLLLPTLPRGVNVVERALEPRLLSSLLQRMRDMLVDLRVPRFTMEQAASLRGFYARLGLAGLFTTSTLGPDFSGLHGRTGVPIGNVFQVARVLMDEGRTGLCQGGCVFNCRALGAGGHPPLHFHATHSFLFCVLHSESQAMLLMGRVLNL